MGVGKQKIVMRVSMENAKRRTKALKTAVGVHGVISAALEGEERDRIVVVGDGVDSVDLTRLLRKRMHCAELLSVEAVKKEEEKKKAEEKKPESAKAIVWPYDYSVPPYSVEIRDNSYSEPPSCGVM